MDGPKVKVCGITRREDALAALDAGADYLGSIVEFPRSPRSVSVDRAGSVFGSLPLRPVAVTVNQRNVRLESIAACLKPQALQLHGDETPEQTEELRSVVDCPIWKTLHLDSAGDTKADADALRGLVALAEGYRRAGVDVIVLDAILREGARVVYGGTGRTVDWALASLFVREVKIPVVLAGGLNPENVGEAVRQVRPFGVDVSSGVESSPGVKDVERIRSFVRNAKSAVQRN